LVGLQAWLTPLLPDSTIEAVHIIDYVCEAPQIWPTITVTEKIGGMLSRQTLTLHQRCLFTDTTPRSFYSKQSRANGF
jgi:hypothetical protein